uniref:Mannosyl-oligosaccharide glucosidase n=1 Tax=Mesocestoides corti TaxID=53468 RepID=A0A5K3ES20_MESCO
MSRGKSIESKPRKRKISNRSDDSKNSTLPSTTKGSAQPLPEKPRIRKSHRKHHGKLFMDLGKEFPRRLTICGVVIVLVVASLHFGIQRYQTMRRQRQVFTPINLPKMIPQHETSPAVSPELFWGSYKPNIFFGMSHRSPNSTVFGLIWASSDEQSVHLRHQCKHAQGVQSYNWIEHDGRNYGIESIISGNHNITVTFVKRSNVPNGGDWSARISVSVVNESRPAKPVSVLFYGYLPDSTKGRIQSYTSGGELKRLRGFTHELGAFQVNFHRVNAFSDRKDESTAPSYLVGHCPREDALLAAVASGLSLRRDMESVVFAGPQRLEQFMRTIPADPVTNLWVTEVTHVPTTSSSSSSTPTTVLEVEFVSQASTSSDAVPLVGAHFDSVLAEYSNQFHANFQKRFPHNAHERTHEQVAMSKVCVSNLLGGIGYFYGSSLIKSPITHGSRDDYGNLQSAIEYGPAGLFTATPSRSQFPRGFLWDEGFHGLLMAQWDAELALQSLSHWLDLLNGEGWIPREQVLGWEARADVPPEFLVQSTSVANPPTLILVVEFLLDRLTAMSPDEAAMFQRWAHNAFPRLHTWFVWFNTTQAGNVPTSYRWRGRPTNNPFQMNPLTLSSGLDDYPRASHPTSDERHVDLRCWMALFARVLARLAEYIDGSGELSASTLAYRAIASDLLDQGKLDELHWDERNGIYADYGLHTDSLMLVRPPASPNAKPDDPPVCAGVQRQLMLDMNAIRDLAPSLNKMYGLASPNSYNTTPFLAPGVLLPPILTSCGSD